MPVPKLFNKYLPIFNFDMQSAPTFTPAKAKYFLLTIDFFGPLAIIIFVLLLLWLLFFSPLFKVSQVQCQLDHLPCPESALLVEIERVKSQNIFRFDTSAFAQRLTSADFTIRQANIKKILPQTLSFELSSVYPVVAIKQVHISEWVIFDDSLRLIRSMSTDPNVPTLIISTPLTLRVGEAPADTELRSLLSLTRTLHRDLPESSSITLTDDALSINFDGKPYQALLSTSGDLSAQIRSLQAILAGATIDQGVRIIDVRFSQPVLK